MTTTSSLFMQPLDILFLRGNQSFGEPGSYGEALMPPWPSVAAGALRSRILVDDKVDLAAFAQGQVHHPSLGTPAQPGSFALQSFQLAHRCKDNGTTELFMPMPADVSVSGGGKDEDDGRHATLEITTLRPTQLHSAIATSSPLPLMPVLAQSQRTKPASGWWLRQNGWQKYLHGQAQAITKDDLIATSKLWTYDERIGIGMDTNTRSAADGKLFTARAVVMGQGVGFAVSVGGALLPTGGTLRLGGDGRAVHLHPCDIAWPQPDYSVIAQAQCARIVLTSPGIFDGGWRLPGMADDNTLRLPGLTARVVAAAVSRAETISGWNLAAWKPKPAQKAAGSASVYWLKDLDATPEALRKLAEHGLWSQPSQDQDHQRRAEGFNRFSFAAY